MPILDGGNADGLPIAPAGLGSVQWILLLANQQLQDNRGIKWTPENMLPYLNLAINEIINLKPDAYTMTRNVTLISGTRQPSPKTVLATEEQGETDTVQVVKILDVTHNMGTGGTTRGKAIISIPKGQIDYLVPDWATFPEAREVRFVIIDEKGDDYYYVFPPQTNGGTYQQIEMLLSVLPLELTATDDEFPLDDSYRPACVDYLVGRALLEETTIPNAQAKGQTFMQKFMQDLGIKSSIEKNNKEKGQ